MIPENHKTSIVQSGINFMRSITDAYGPDEGMKLWDTICSTIDPSIKGEIFFALLTGEYNDRITVKSYDKNSNFIERIKAIRFATGCGLKEAKDLGDLLNTGAAITLTVNPKHRESYLRELRNAGMHV